MVKPLDSEQEHRVRKELRKELESHPAQKQRGNGALGHTRQGQGQAGECPGVWELAVGARVSCVRLGRAGHGAFVLCC